MQSAPKDCGHDVVLDHLGAGGPSVTHVRGVLLAGSLLALKELSLYDRYVASLPSEHRDTILYGVAASWVPIGVALVHYQTCDTLALSPAELRMAGERVSKQLADTFMATLVRASRDAGLNALWVAVKQSDRVWDRLFTGGGCTVLRTSPKDLTFEIHGVPLASTTHFRNAHLGLAQSLASLFCKAVFVKPVRPRVPHPHTIATAISWV